MQRSWKPSRGRPLPEFESLPLRQLKSLTLMSGSFFLRRRRIRLRLCLSSAGRACNSSRACAPVPSGLPPRCHWFCRPKWHLRSFWLSNSLRQLKSLTLMSGSFFMAKTHQTAFFILSATVSVRTISSRMMGWVFRHNIWPALRHNRKHRRAKSSIPVFQSEFVAAVASFPMPKAEECCKMKSTAAELPVI